MREIFRKWFQSWLLAHWQEGFPRLIMQGEAVPGGEFARASIQFGNTVPAQVGRGMKRTIVFGAVQIFLADETGTKKANLVADKLAEEFTASVFSHEGLSIRVIEVTGPQFIGRQDEGEQFNVIVQFEADEN